MTYTIYRITCELTSLAYIGQTSLTIKKRLKAHLDDSIRPGNRCRIFYSAIRAYGEDAFIISKITTCQDPESADVLEKYYIKKYNTLHPNGYNLQDGGQLTKKQHPTTSTIISQTSKGRNQGRNNPRAQTKYVGVLNFKHHKGWHAQIECDGKKYAKSGFEKPIDSAHYYDMMAIYFFGKDAKLNFPNKNYKLPKNFQYDFIKEHPTKIKNIYSKKTSGTIKYGYSKMIQGITYRAFAFHTQDEALQALNEFIHSCELLYTQENEEHH